MDFLIRKIARPGSTERPRRGRAGRGAWFLLA